jgi:hypothetical protein
MQALLSTTGSGSSHKTRTKCTHYRPSAQQVSVRTMVQRSIIQRQKGLVQAVKQEQIALLG